MTENDYTPRPAAVVIERKRVAANISVRAASKDAGLSEGRWRQIAKGYQRAAKGVDVPVNAPDATLARMALAVGVTQEELDAAGEDTVSAELEVLDLSSSISTAGKRARDAALSGARPVEDVARLHLELIARAESAIGFAEAAAELGAARSIVADIAQSVISALLDSGASALVIMVDQERMYRLFDRASAVSSLGRVPQGDRDTPLRVRLGRPDGADRSGGGVPIEYIDRADVDPEDYVVAASDADDDAEIEAWQQEP